MIETNLQSDVVSAVYHGRTVIGTSAAQVLTAVLPNAVKGVQLKAASTNTGVVYVGKSGVTAGTAVATDGMPLSAGEGIFIPLSDVSAIYAIGSAAAQDLYWMVV